MAAYIVCPSKEHWEFISDFLTECQQGAIILSPDIQKAIEKRFNLSEGHVAEETRGELVVYDYGGECDKMLDQPTNMRHMSIPLVLEALGLEFDPEDL